MSIECDSYLQQVAIEKSFDLNVNALRAVMDLWISLVIRNSF